MPFTKPARHVDRVFLHCSASDNPDHDDIAAIHSWHVDDRGWSDVGYHYFIRSDGALQEGRPLERTPAAQAGHNAGTVAICLHGLAAENFTDDQLRTLTALARETRSESTPIEAGFYSDHRFAAPLGPEPSVN